MALFGLSISASANTLSLKDCLSLAAQKSPQMVAAVLGTENAKAVSKETFAGKLPTLSALGVLDQSNNQAIQAIDTNMSVLRLQQMISPLSPRWVLAAQKKEEYRAALSAQIATRNDVALVVKDLYFGILKDRDQILNFNRVEKKLSDLKDAVLPRYTVGRAPPFDLVKAQSALYDLKKARALLSADLDAQKEALAQILGFSSGHDIDLQPLSTLPAIPAASALEKNPLIESLNQKVSAARLALKAQKFERLPALMGSLDYGYEGDTFNFPYHVSNPPPVAGNSYYGLGWNASVQLSFPLWTWGAISSRVAQRRAALKLAENNLAEALQRLRVLWVGASETAKAQLDDEKLRLSFIPASKKVAEVSIPRYRLGAIGILEVSDALSLWLQTVLGERGDYYSYLSDLAQMEHVIGTDVIDYGQ